MLARRPCSRCSARCSRDESPVLTLLSPVEVEVDRLVTLLFVVLRPVTGCRRCCWSCSARAQRLLRRPVLTLLSPVEVEVDRLVTLLLVVLSPVLRLETPVLTDERPVLTLLSPVEVEVDRLVTLLLVVLRPVHRLPTLLFVVLSPVLRLRRPCSRCSARCSARTTPVLSPVLSDETPVLTLLNPVEVEVDRLVTLLFVVLSPVDRLLTCARSAGRRSRGPCSRCSAAGAQRRDARAHTAQPGRGRGRQAGHVAVGRAQAGAQAARRRCSNC